MFNSIMEFSFVLSSIILVLSVSQATSDSPPLQNFLLCLPNYSLTSNPVSEAIYTTTNSSFYDILYLYAHNRRYKTPTTPKPLAIITALHESHVQATVICAKTHGIQLRIRSGGHDYEGLSYVSEVPFVILDMFPLKSIQIDIENGTAWVQAGATMGQIYHHIAKKSRVHAIPAGVGISVGAGGHFSGGGYGNLMRKYGLSVDNIIDAQLVDANGNILDRKSMGENVFWAIRGGGGASFGVILSWTIKLVSVPETVTVFRVNRTVEEGAVDILYKWQLVAPYLHEDLFIRAMSQVLNGTQPGNRRLVVFFIGQFLGQVDRLLPLLNESFPELGLKQSDCIEMPWVNSTLFWADFPIGTSIEALLTNPTALYFKSRSDYVKKPIPKAAIRSIWDLMIKGEMLVNQLQWNPYGGKMHEILPSATPFPHRAGNLFKIQYYTSWPEDGIDVTNHYLNYSRSLYELMTPYVSQSPRESFLNYRDLDIGANYPSNVTNVDIARTYGSKYFKDNFERLGHAKSRVDPENFFRHEQNIPPLPL